MMYTIDKDSSRDCIYVLKKRFIATQNIKGELDFCWSRTTTTFSSFSKDFFSHSNIYWMWAAAWEEKNVATAVTVCVLPDSLESYSFLQKGKEVSLLLTLFKAPFAWIHIDNQVC